MAETNGDIRDSAGRFGKGNPGKPKGAVTKVSVKVRESIVNFLEANIDTIQADFDTLKPRERLQFVSDILQYAAPKLSSVQSDVKTEGTQQIIVKWDKSLIPNLSTE